MNESSDQLQKETEQYGDHLVCADCEHYEEAEETAACPECGSARTYLYEVPDEWEGDEEERIQLDIKRLRKGPNDGELPDLNDGEV